MHTYVNYDTSHQRLAGRFPNAPTYHLTDNAAVPRDTWTHFAVSFWRINSTNHNLTSYVNGVQAKSYISSGNLTPDTTDFYLGGVVTYFNGTMDEVIVFNRSLSAEQVQALYENRTDLIVSQETAAGETWQAYLTPNDGTADGITKASNTLTIIAADLSISTSDITYSPSSPNETDTVTINATVHNNNYQNINNVNVSFYLDNAFQNSTLKNITQNSNATASFTWTATGGTRTIKIAIDPQNAVSEADKTNNNATKSITVNKVVAVNVTYPLNGTALPRGNNAASGEDEAGVVSNSLTLTANLYNYYNTSEGVNGTNCTFYWDSAYLSSDLTDSNGDCSYSYDKSSQSIAWHNITVNFTNLESGYAEHSTLKEQTNQLYLDQYLTSLTPNNMRTVDGGTLGYMGGDAAILNLSITKNGAAYDPANITVNATTSALDLIATHYYPGDIVKTNTGKYYSKTIVNSSLGGYIRWSVYLLDDDSYLSSGIEADRKVINATATLNFTTQDETSAFISGSSMKLYDRNNYLIDTYTAAVTSKSSALNDLYTLDFSTPRGSLRINDFNLSAASLSLSPQIVETYAGPTPAAYPRFSSTIALNDTGLSYTNTNLTIPKGNVGDVRNICHCDNWNFSSGKCISAGDWQCNDTSDYTGFDYNTTHLWFTVTSFTGYGAAGYNSNLTIWDDTNDPEGENTAHYIDDLVGFYANYTNTTSGAVITGANCDIYFTDTGWSGMSYNSTSELHEYNRTFSSSGTVNWQANCSAAGYDNQSAQDDAYITPTAAAIPEFSDFAVLLILVVVIGGFLAMKKLNLKT